MEEGSGDSMINVRAAALYHVFDNRCMRRTFHDTVALIQELPIDCSVGLERIKCNADTVRINVPTDF
jgi:hypothetical protein